MKKTLAWFLLVSLCICMVPVSAAAAQTAINITSNLPGADVYVDNKLVGVTPMENYSVTAGNHTVRISMPGYTTKEGTFSGGGTINLNMDPELYPSQYKYKVTQLTVDNASLTLEDAVAQAMADNSDTWYLIGFADTIDTVCLSEQLVINRRGKMTINGDGRVSIAKTCLESALNVICSDVRLVGLIFDSDKDYSANNEKSMLSLRIPENYTDKAYNLNNIYVLGCTMDHISEVGAGTCGDYGHAAAEYNGAGTANFSNLVFSGNHFDGTGLFSFAGAGDEDYNIIDGYYICGNTFTDAGIGMLAADAHTWYVYSDEEECQTGKIAYCEHNILRNVLIAGNRITMTENGKHEWENIILVSCANLGNSHNLTENVEIRHNTSRITGGRKNQFSTVNISNTTVSDSYEDGKTYNSYVTPGMEHTDYNTLRNVSIHDNDFQLGTSRDFQILNVKADVGEQCGSHNTMENIRVENNRIEAYCGVSICNYTGNSESGLCEDNQMSDIYFTGNKLYRSGSEYSDTGVKIAACSISQNGHETDDMPQYHGDMSDIHVSDNVIQNFSYGIAACGAAGDYADGFTLSDVSIERNRIVNVNYKPYPIVDMGIVVAGSAFQTPGDPRSTPEGKDKYHLSSINCTVRDVSIKDNDITAICGISVSGLFATSDIQYPSTGNKAAAVTVTGNTITRRTITEDNPQNCPGIITGDVVEVWYKLGFAGADKWSYVGGCDASSLLISGNTSTGFEVAEDIVHSFCRSQWDNQWSWLSDGENKMGKRTSGDLWVYANITESQLLLTDNGQSVYADFTLHEGEMVIVAFYDQNGKMKSCCVTENPTERLAAEKPEGSRSAKGFLLKNGLPVCCSQILY